MVFVILLTVISHLLLPLDLFSELYYKFKSCFILVFVENFVPELHLHHKNLSSQIFLSFIYNINK